MEVGPLWTSDRQRGYIFASSKDVAPQMAWLSLSKEMGSLRCLGRSQKETELFWEVSDYERERQKASDGVWLNAGGES